MEIILGATIQREMWKGIDYYRSLNPDAAPGVVITGGEECQRRSSGPRLPGYSDIGDVMSFPP